MSMGINQTWNCNHFRTVFGVTERNIVLIYPFLDLVGWPYFRYFSFVVNSYWDVARRFNTATSLGLDIQLFIIGSENLFDIFE